MIYIYMIHIYIYPILSLLWMVFSDTPVGVYHEKTDLPTLRPASKSPSKSLACAETSPFSPPRAGHPSPQCGHVRAKGT